jgi:hypothetical protein
MSSEDTAAFRRPHFGLSVDPDLIEDIAVLIDCAPQPVLLAADGDDDLVEVPDVATARPQGKAKGQPNRMSDDRRRKSMTLVAEPVYTACRMPELT